MQKPSYQDALANDMVNHVMVVLLPRRTPPPRPLPHLLQVQSQKAHPPHPQLLNDCCLAYSLQFLEHLAWPVAVSHRTC